MRNAIRLALVAAVAAVAVPTTSAHAIACKEPLREACYQICKVYYELGEPCPR